MDRSKTLWWRSEREAEKWAQSKVHTEEAYTAIVIGWVRICSCDSLSRRLVERGGWSDRGVVRVASREWCGYIVGRLETSSCRIRCARLARGGAITSASGLSNRDTVLERSFSTDKSVRQTRSVLRDSDSVLTGNWWIVVNSRGQISWIKSKDWNKETDEENVDKTGDSASGD